MLNDPTQIVSHTHNSVDKLSKEQISQEVEETIARLTSQFQEKPQKLQTFLQILNDLSEFEFGRFLIKNKGALSSYWTWYVILGFVQSEITSPLEKFILEKSPAILATRERFGIFQKLLKQHITSNNVVCSVPCGSMADLLTLYLPNTIKDVKFIGIDIDPTVFDFAKKLQQQSKNKFVCDFFVKDAWQLNQEEQYDIITSNGLNIYEKEDDKVISLYRTFYHALKKNGKLICSAFTHPPGGVEVTEWNLDMLNQEDMKLYSSIVKFILQATWTNFRSSDKTCAQLKAAGFKEVQIYWDKQRIFPTFCAAK